MNEIREFRYSVEQVDKILKLLKQQKQVEADIDYDEEVDEMVQELSLHGIYKIEDWEQDANSVDLDDNPDYYGSLGFCTKRTSKKDVKPNDVMVVDFFYTDVPEDNEYELMWGS